MTKKLNDANDADKKPVCPGAPRKSINKRYINSNPNNLFHVTKNLNKAWVESENVIKHAISTTLPSLPAHRNS